ncbi:MAG: succinate dehydrogenase iron-sulfur subunit [Candidatus Thermoplasmatota archaeon]|jgi:succinate dehydrogenase / fumarate reductase iron-sulfur subunit|nr:succinate dehydrogenase iron-sulfur subunit [Candidatus Thermoplasmatota archaeon]
MDEYTVEIKRTDVDGKTRMQTFKVPKDKVSTVLETLLYIKGYLDQTLTFRYSCGMEICGSCGMEINGKPHMACSFVLDNFKGDKILIEPLKHFKILRDLAVDIDPFFDKYKAVKPYVIRNDDGNYQKELLQTPKQFDEYIDYSMCIKCGLCMAACPIEGSDENYLGPAPLTAAWRFIADNRDQGKKMRLEIVSGAEGASRCHFAGECTEVCPKGVNPSFAIQKLRSSMIGLEFQKLFGGK